VVDFGRVSPPPERPEAAGCDRRLVPDLHGQQAGDRRSIIEAHPSRTFAPTNGKKRPQECFTPVH